MAELGIARSAWSGPGRAIGDSRLGAMVEMGSALTLTGLGFPEARVVARRLGVAPGGKGGLGVDHEQCSACEFDGSEYGPAQLLEAIRNLGPQWKRILLDAGDDLRKRPAPATWSALEYAAHSRDITALHVFGVEQALMIDEPEFPEVAGDELVENAAASYASQDPGLVGIELEDQALELAGLAQASGPASWSRGITFGSSRSDVRLLLEHALHDSHHHLVDVTKGLAVLRSSSL